MIKNILSKLQSWRFAEPLWTHSLCWYCWAFWCSFLFFFFLLWLRLYSFCALQHTLESATDCGPFVCIFGKLDGRKMSAKACTYVNRLSIFPTWWCSLLNETHLDMTWEGGLKIPKINFFWKKENMPNIYTPNVCQISVSNCNMWILLAIWFRTEALLSSWRGGILLCKLHCFKKKGGQKTWVANMKAVLAPSLHASKRLRAARINKHCAHSLSPSYALC